MGKILDKHAFSHAGLSKEEDFMSFPLRLSKIAPSVLAILTQLGAVLAVLITVWVISLTSYAYLQRISSFSIFGLVLLQSFYSVTISRWIGMATWWHWIHFLFPLTVWGLSNFEIPSAIYLVGFIFSLSLFWTTFRTQVPFFPSQPVIWQQVAQLIPQNKAIRFIDIGSGLGDMSMTIANMRPDCKIEGVEIAPLLWAVSFLRAKMRGSKAQFILGDYHNINFANYDIVFAYLSPAAMSALWDKASKEMIKDSLLISLEFEITGITPTIRISNTVKSPTVYVWKMP